MYDRLAVPEAAQALGLTEGAIRQRIQRGTLESERDEDGRVHVLVRRHNGRDDGDKTASDTRFNGGFNAHSEAVEILKNQNEFLKGQLEAERGASAELRRIVAGLVQRIPELEAPQRSPDHPQTDGDGTGGVGHAVPGEAQEDAQPRPERSWWRRWFGFE